MGGLDDVRILPSLWTAKPIGDSSSPPDGFHTMSEMKKMAQKSSMGFSGIRRPPTGSFHSNRVTSPDAHTAGSAVRRSESVPILPDATPPRSGSSCFLPDEDSLPHLTQSGTWKKDRKTSRSKLRVKAGDDMMRMTVP